MAIIDNLRLSQDAMEAAINNFEARKNAFENVCKKIADEVKTLDGTWQGEANEKFNTQFEAMHQNLQQNITAMTNIINNLKKALSIYEAKEEVVTKMMDALETFTKYIGVL